MPVFDTKAFGHDCAVVLVIVSDIDERDAALPLDEHIAPGELDGSAVKGAVRNKALRRLRHPTIFKHPYRIIRHEVLPTRLSIIRFTFHGERACATQQP